MNKRQKSYRTEHASDYGYLTYYYRSLKKLKIKLSNVRSSMSAFSTDGWLDFF